MAFGDIGGPVTALIITCRTSASGTVAIVPGDAVKLVGPYEVSNVLDAGDPVFGQALSACVLNDAAIPVRVRGICAFRYAGNAPEVDGVSGVVCAQGAGEVEAPDTGVGVGLTVKVNSAASTVEVLL